MKKFLPVLAIIILLGSVVIPTAAMAADGGAATPRGGSGDPKMSLSAIITVSDGDVITIVDGNSYIVDAGATATLRMEEGSPALTSVEILCDPGVTLTIENVNIDLSASEDQLLLAFIGTGNRLILVGDNTLIGSFYTPAVLVESLTELVISGVGKLTAIGGNMDFLGSGGAGIGGADGVVYEANCGKVVIEGGIVAATGGPEGAGIGGGGYGNGGDIDILGDAIVYARGGAAADDIGQGVGDGLAGSLLIGDDAVLFAYWASLPGIVAITPNHLVQVPALPPIIDLYGPLPASWGGVADIVFYVGFNVLYEPNGGAGTTEDPGRPYPGGSATAMANGFTRSGYTFAGWNTAPDGSGTGYDPGDTVTVPVEGVRLYAMWELAANPRTGEAGSFGFVFVLIAVMALMVVGFVVRRKAVAKE